MNSKEKIAFRAGLVENQRPTQDVFRYQVKVIFKHISVGLSSAR